MNLFTRNIFWSLILPLVLLHLTAMAQTDSIASKNAPPKSVLVIQQQVHIGKMLKIYRYFPQTNYIDLNEVNIAFQTAGSKEWHQSYRYPQVGVALL